MKIDCEVIRDLLPLYADEACSEKSRDMVEEHLQECGDCRKQLDMLRQTEIDECLQTEKTAVIQYGAQQFRRRTAVVGSTVSGFFMIPILAYLIINIYSGSPMGIFLIVLSSLLVAASLIVVPIMLTEDRLFWTFCAFCASVVLLLAVICLFVRGNWFWTASSAVLFGLGVVFLPFAVRAKPVQKLIGNSNKALVVLLLDAGLFVNMISMIRCGGKFTNTSVLFTIGVFAGIWLVLTQIVRRSRLGR